MTLPIDQIVCGDCFEVLKGFPEESIDLVMFSPPYWGLRDYKIPKVDDVFAVGGLGLESHPSQYIKRMVVLGSLLKRVLKKSGSMWINMGDTYFASGGAGGQYEKFSPNRKEIVSDYKQPKVPHDKGWLQPKQKLLIPERVAIALQEDGWILRNDVIWHKPNHMPAGVKDRLTTSWEHLYFFVKSRRYFFDLDAIRQPHLWAEKDKRSLKRRVEGKSGKIVEGLYVTNAVGSPRARNERVSIKQGSHHGSSLTSGRATHYEKQLIEDNTLGKNPSDTIEDFWSLTTQPYKGAHFAVYPEKLCENPIKAACPQWICSVCGKPKTRITKTSYLVDRETPKGQEPKAQHSSRERGNQFATMSFAHAYGFHETVGWSTCNCQAPFNNGIVLDPMCGSGTTLIVARKFCRHYIGIELNPSYVEMAKQRLSQIPERIDTFIEQGAKT